MHELALCQAIVDTVVDRADGRELRRVEVRIGHLRQVVPSSLVFSWELLVEGTDLAGCTLAIEPVPAVVACRHCGARTTLDWPVLRCGACASFEVDLLSGTELDIASIDVGQEVC